MTRALNIIIHSPPLTRQDHCKTHGPFQSKCFAGHTWVGCPTCDDERLKAEADRVEAQKRKRQVLEWESKLGTSGIPERFIDRTLDNFKAATDAQRFALSFSRDYADNFAEVLKTGRGAMFIGKPGTGKTHLAAGIGMQLMRQQGRAVLFTTVMRAVRRVKDSWTKGGETETQAIAAMVFPDLLILDEVGVQFGSEFEKNILFDVLNERYVKRRPTLFLSNLAKDEVVAFVGDRIMDRLREDGGKLIPFTWESHRVQRA